MLGQNPHIPYYLPRKRPDDKNGPAAAADNNLPQKDGLEINLEFDDLNLINDDI